MTTPTSNQTIRERLSAYVFAFFCWFSVTIAALYAFCSGRFEALGGLWWLMLIFSVVGPAVCIHHVRVFCQLVSKLSTSES